MTFMGKKFLYRNTEYFTSYKIKTLIKNFYASLFFKKYSNDYIIE